MYNQAIRALMQNNTGEIIRTENEASKELREMANWYLRGTGRTPSDMQYAIKCAIEDVLEAEAEAYKNKKAN
jgi:hypothetical protein